MERKEIFTQYYKNMIHNFDLDPNVWLSNYIIERMELNEEQILWFCFLSSITYHLPTAYLLINEYPDLESVDIPRLTKWWEEINHLCPFQTDKLKQRKFLPETVESYQKLVNGDQKKFFDGLLVGSGNENFELMWNSTYRNVKHFGRFSVWNWSQMLKQVAGYNIEPSTLLLGESFSESHTHGSCYVCNKDEWAKKERYIEDGKRKKKVHKFLKEEKEFLEDEMNDILNHLSENSDVIVDNYFLETVLCSFKKLFRERDSRYVGYYLDRQAKDIRDIESKGWYGVDWSILWDARREILDSSLTDDNRILKERFLEDIEEKILPKSKEIQLNLF